MTEMVWTEQKQKVLRRDGKKYYIEKILMTQITIGHHQMANTEIRLIIFFAAKDGEALYSQQKKRPGTVAQIMNSLLPNSDLNWRKWGKPLDHLDMT